MRAIALIIKKVLLEQDKNYLKNTLQFSVLVKNICLGKVYEHLLTYCL